MTDRLPPGLYESLLTLGLRDAIARLQAEGWSADVDAVDALLLADVLADHVRDVARRSIDGVRGDGPERLSAQVDLVNRVISMLRAGGGETAVPEEVSIASNGSILREIREPSLVPGVQGGRLRPHLSLRESALLVNAHRDFQVGAQVEREIASADRVDLLCAFVRFAGLRLVREQLEAFVRRGGRLRVIASVYTGSTEKRALDELVGLGARVKVSYETDQTRLHAKAWLFDRLSGYHTAYIGSSNLTHSALVEGVEWNVRLSASDNGPIIERVRATFEQYWNEPAFVDYLPERDGQRLADALAQQRGPSPVDDVERLIALNLDLRPQPHQEQMLDELDAERRRGHRRNLVVAATGTGKTWVSAFDYQRLRAQGHDRLLFVAHRDEILRQSRLVFQLVLKDPSFGERFVAAERPVEGTHVFASIQTLHRHVERIDPAAWDVVIVDEFHHAEAATYRRLLERLRPSYLIGLTATPERADGQSVFHWFDDRIATEVRLWQALDQGLLSPFHYFGSYDGSDLRAVPFRRGQYAARELETLYLSDRERATRVLEVIARHVIDPSGMRALGFCAGVDHARFMAERFNSAGLHAIALHAGSPPDERQAAVGRLRRGELQAIFTVDLFNEGVDIPEVDTILLLRPTESATVFLQQLGRGLRHAEGKSVLTVLDFIGQAHKDYRFDVRYRALVGGTVRQLTRAIEEGFPVLPAGCAIRLDRLSADAVLKNIKSGTWNSRRALTQDLAAMPRTTRLPDFLAAGEHELEDVYARPSSGHSFTTLRAAAHPTAVRSGDPTDFDRAFGRMLHVDDEERATTWRTWLERDQPPAAIPDESMEGRLQLMLFGLFGGRNRPLRDLPALFERLWRDEARRTELFDLLGTLRDRSRAATRPLRSDGVLPLESHGHYSLIEIIGAFGAVSNGVLRDVREGKYRDEPSRTDCFFVTLEKSERDYSPTTRYEDYPISPTLFHWESQSTTSVESATGQRYLRHRASGDRILLFVRERKSDGRGETSPYTCLGYASYVRHESSRPIRITWELDRPMPARFFQEAKVAAG